MVAEVMDRAAVALLEEGAAGAHGPRNMVLRLRLVNLSLTVLHLLGFSLLRSWVRSLAQTMGAMEL